MEGPVEEANKDDRLDGLSLTDLANRVGLIAFDYTVENPRVERQSVRRFRL